MFVPASMLSKARMNVAEWIGDDWGSTTTPENENIVERFFQPDQY